jgi:NodT family efflux transporter outer membrane factor (OMF) lipoprotein
MRRAALLLGAALLAGCIEPTPPPGLKAGDVPAAFEQGAGPAAWPAPDWWQGFGSAELTALENSARDANLDIAQAAARLRQADARARQAGAALLPTVTASGNAQNFSGSNTSNSGTETNFFAGAGVSYELDFWGKNRAGLDSANAARRASRADQATVALTTSAAIATGYFQLLSLRERLAVARANLASAQAILGSVQRRVRGGAAPNADLIQARADVAAQVSALPPLEQQELEARTALAILLGRPPEGFTVSATDLSSLAAPVVAPGLPSELLARRPDIAAAEANLAAAHADIAAARAAMLPDITLTALGGVQNPAINAAVLTLEGTGFGLTLGAAVAQTIFDGGRLEAKTAETEAREEELLAAYRAAVIAAFGDVENALGGLSHLAAQERALQDQLREAENVLRAARRKYEGGASDFLVVTDAQRSLYTLRDQLSDIRRARLAASVTLYKALGGGWTTPN